MLQTIKYYRTSCFCGILIVVLSACKPVSYLSITNLSNYYTNRGNPIGFNCLVSNVDDSVSNALIQFPYSSLSALSKKGEKAFRLKICYQLIRTIQDNRIIDSTSFFIKDTLINRAGCFSTSFDFKAISGTNYILKLEVADLNTDNHYMLLVPFSKAARASAEWFRLESEKDGLIFNNYVSNNHRIRLISTDTSLKSIYCKAFNAPFPAAIPPFIEKERQLFHYKFDSVFEVNLKSGKSEFLPLKRQGFYFFQTDTSILEGITFLRFHEDYPKITSSRKMVESLLYITTSNEYDKLLSNASPKETLDSFWVASAGGAERAIELIRNYYSRVEEANRFFLSYCEGWKTDRGIIYIIFGPPNLVYRSDQQEIWTYGEENNFKSIRFLFLKVRNPFTNNDYVLQRQFNYKDIWYNAVQQWRR